MRILYPLLLASMLVIGGCTAVSEAVSERVHNKFDRSPAKTKEFLADYRSVFEAAKLAMKRIGYTVSRSATEGSVVVGYSQIQPGDPTRAARQLHLTVTLTEIGPRQVDVSLLMTEQLEGGLGNSGEVPLREHGLYDSYYAALQDILNETAGRPATGGG